MSLALLAVPTSWIILNEPVLGQAPYGFRRRVRAAGFAADDPAGLACALAPPAAC